MKNVPTFVAMLVLAGLAFMSGCSAPQPLGVWDANLEALAVRKQRVDPADIEYFELPFDSVSRGKQVSGYAVVGISQFVAEVQNTVPGSRQSSLREAALKVGAHRVEWAKKSLGVQDRRGIRMRGGGAPPPPPPAFEQSPSTYQWEATTIAPSGTYQSRGMLTPTPGQPSFGDSFARGLALGQHNSAMAAFMLSNMESYTYRAEVFEYIAVFYRRDAPPR